MSGDRSESGGNPEHRKSHLPTAIGRSGGVIYVTTPGSSQREPYRFVAGRDGLRSDLEGKHRQRANAAAAWLAILGWTPIKQDRRGRDPGHGIGPDEAVTIVTMMETEVRRLTEAEAAAADRARRERVHQRDRRVNRARRRSIRLEAADIVARRTHWSARTVLNLWRRRDEVRAAASSRVRRYRYIMGSGRTVELTEAELRGDHVLRGEDDADVIVLVQQVEQGPPEGQRRDQ